ncbi:MAG: hypothetical protein ACLGIR_08220 [Actinomycetes bacterium]
MPPSKQDVERVIAAVPGVVSAAVGTGASGGKGRLRIRLEDGVDAVRVSQDVAAALHDEFGIDVDPATLVPPGVVPAAVPASVGAAGEQEVLGALRADAPLRPGTRLPDAADAGAAPAPAEPEVAEPEAQDDALSLQVEEPAEPVAPPVDDTEEETVVQLAAETTETPAEPEFTVLDDGVAADAEDHVALTQRVTEGTLRRPKIEHVQVRRDGLEVRVEVTLSADDDRVVRTAVGANTRKGTLRAAVRATLDAAEALVDARMKGELEAIDLVHDGEDDRCTVTVSLLTLAGEEKLVGVSLTRGEPVAGTVRATLDAINRRVQLLRAELEPA